MSRGHGTVQQAILRYLATDPSGVLPSSGAPQDTSLWRVTCGVFSTTLPTDAQRASVRRAARALYREGLIQMTDRVAQGMWSGADANARFYRRQQQQVAVSERYISRLATPEEDTRYRAVLHKLGIKRK